MNMKVASAIHSIKNVPFSLIYLIPMSVLITVIST